MNNISMKSSWASAQEDFMEFSCHKSSRSYINNIYRIYLLTQTAQVFVSERQLD